MMHHLKNCLVTSVYFVQKYLKCVCLCFIVCIINCCCYCRFYFFHLRSHTNIHIQAYNRFTHYRWRNISGFSYTHTLFFFLLFMCIIPLQAWPFIFYRKIRIIINNENSIFLTLSPCCWCLYFLPFWKKFS